MGGKKRKNRLKPRHRTDFAYVFPEIPADMPARVLNPTLPVQARCGLPARILEVDFRKPYWKVSALILCNPPVPVVLNEYGRYHLADNVPHEHDIFNTSLETWCKTLGREIQANSESKANG